VYSTEKQNAASGPNALLLPFQSSKRSDIGNTEERIRKSTNGYSIRLFKKKCSETHVLLTMQHTFHTKIYMEVSPDITANIALFGFVA
jgi:uncharacterized protein YxeA